MEIIIIIALLVVAAYLAWKMRKLQEEHRDLVALQGDVEEKEGQLQEVEIALQQNQEKLRSMQNDITEIKEKTSAANLELYDVQLKVISSTKELEVTKGQVQNQLSLLQAYEEQHQANTRLQEESIKKAAEVAKEKIDAIQTECQRKIAEKLTQTDSVLLDLENNIESERQKYLSIIKTIQEAQPKEEKDLSRHVQIGTMAQEDISYLLNNVAPHLHESDILYKLIWSEFIQRPTNNMLDYVLPHKDCAGIYKITNDRNKKAYIGRSTSVRKRLTDHIKSTVGISTIADQRIHQIMREEGLWNFSFELIEECDKDKLNEREKYYIDFFQTAETTYGYNQKAGG